MEVVFYGLKQRYEYYVFVYVSHISVSKVKQFGLKGAFGTIPALKASRIYI